MTNYHDRADAAAEARESNAVPPEGDVGEAAYLVRHAQALASNEANTAPTDPSQARVEQVVTLLRDVFRRLPSSEDPEELRRFLDVTEAARVFAERVVHSSVLVNAAAAIRILNERKLGACLERAHREPGKRSGTSEYQVLLADLRITYRTATRMRQLASGDDWIVEEYLREALTNLDLLERGEPATASAGPLISTGELLRRLGAAPARRRRGPEQWTPPASLRTAAETTLDGITLEIPRDGMRKPDWSGRLFVVTVPAQAEQDCDTLLRCFTAGWVEAAVIVLPFDSGSPYWTLFCRWPHALLPRNGFDRAPHQDLVAVCLGADDAMTDRFARAFSPFGSVYPEGAVDTTATADGASGGDA